MSVEEENYVYDATLDDPEGAVCGWCDGPNDFADDIGWFYATPEGRDERPTCKACWHGDIGKKHEARWGIGFR